MTGFLQGYRPVVTLRSVPLMWTDCAVSFPMQVLKAHVLVLLDRVSREAVGNRARVPIPVAASRPPKQRECVGGPEC